ncbi:MAG: restriction endonuclease subunit S [Cytophagales bacterium]|nr:restriction endonuclease subunit S [Cytophagales bacterium]MCA6367877.1 restriction endonuclease subunit S [Cytophagales bacterium]MCA6371052.1 restriction endonuclease subunit S [Cytophagales bacterium]MCA6377196.1 restriction endonuclease subunit S [Cytophagales bacterium]MCA6384637.1 restriction endonuclease subunit S [Cytophagales bacterium]
MNSINEYNFSDLYEMGSGISSKPEQAGHGAPFVSFSTVFNNYFLPEKVKDLMDTSEDEQEVYSVKGGDILLTRTSETIDELGMSCVVLEDYPRATFSGFVKRLRPTQSDVTYPKFMGFYLRSKFFRKTMTNNAVLTLRASLNEDIFSYLKLYLPDYDIQKKIGDFLCSLNAKIDLNNRINAELEVMAKIIYDYWFVQFDFPDKKGKPYKTSGGKMVWSEELKREIPEGWEVIKISTLAPVVTGKQDANYASANGMYNFFTCGEETLKCDSFEFEGKAVLVAGNGNFNIKRYEGQFNAYQRTYVLIPYNEKHYTLIYLAAKDRIVTLTKGSRGSIVKFITKGDLEDIQVALPKEDKLDLFTVLNSITSTMEKRIEENQKLTELRDWLLPMLMNGQVKIKDAEQESSFAIGTEDKLAMAAEPETNYRKKK